MKIFDFLQREPVTKVFDVLESTGATVYVVGGCVRNSILCKPVKDIDFATDLEPTEVISLAKKFGLRWIPTGIEHGTITLVCQDSFFHITSFRSDVETYGRRAKIKYSDSILDDASRRDFTINALYLNREGELVDPLNGYADLLKKKVKFIGDPEERIKEDYLRVLRFFRFSVLYGAPDKYLDIDGLAACKYCLEGLKSLSANRVWSELKLILSSQNLKTVVPHLESSGVLEVIIPGFDTNNLEIFFKNEVAKKINLSPLIRLKMLTGTESRPCHSLFPFSSLEKKFLIDLERCIEEKTINSVIAYRYGELTALGALLICSSKAGEYVTDEDIKAVKIGAKQVFPLRGEDLIPFQKPSRSLGIELKRLEKVWIDSGFSLDKSELLIQIKIAKF